MNTKNLTKVNDQLYVANRAGDYPMPVLIYTPKNCGAVPKRMVLYLHGWRGICDHVNDGIQMMFKIFNLQDQLEKYAPADTVFVMPLSNGRCDNFKANLVPKLTQFNDWLRGIFDTDIPCYIAGHSGAYLPIVQILSTPGHFAGFTKGVILLDALYGSVADYEKELKQNASLKIQSVYLKRGGTDQPSKDLARAYPTRVTAIPAQTTAHCQVPNIHFGPMLKEIMS